MDKPSPVERMDAERKVLEELFTSRFNAYLVAVGLFSVALTSTDLTPVYRFWLFSAGLIASLTMFLSLMRTHVLITRALNFITSRDQTHPYTLLTEGWIFPPLRANTIMLAIPLLMSGIFAWQLVRAHFESPEVVAVALWHLPV